MIRFYIFFLAIFSIVVGQAQNLEWAIDFSTKGASEGNAFAYDGSGNIYSTGFFEDTADFDPGPGIYNLISEGNDDIFISKTDVNGNIVWAINMGGTGIDEGRAIHLDNSGNIIVSGVFENTVDLDPGPGISNFTSSGLYDIFIIKLDTSGNLIWAKTLGDVQIENIYSMAVDGSGNIYLTGDFRGTVDFDPGPGVYNASMVALASAIYILKLDSNGDFVWVKHTSGQAIIVGGSIYIGAFNNIYVTGYFSNTHDFDFGPGNYFMTGIVNSDIFVLKLDINGNFIWAFKMGGQGPIGFSERGHSIIEDSKFNIVVAGVYRDTADFDPGPGVYNLISNGNFDMFIAKYDSSGNFIWARSMGTSSADYCYAVDTDTADNIYATGRFFGTVDFDPGPSVHNLTSNLGTDIFVLKLDSAGNFVWAHSFGSTYMDHGNAIFVDTLNNVHVIGRFAGTVDFDPTSNTYNLSTYGSQFDVFVLKLNQCNPPALSVSTTGNNLCPGDSLVTATVSASGGTSPYTYTWSNGDTTQSTSGLSAGTYFITVTDDSSCAAISSIVITGPSAIISNISSIPTNFSSPNCNGTVSSNPTGGTPPYNIIWSSGATTNLCEGWYMATITDANGCVTSDSVYVDFQCPSILISVATTGPPLCPGDVQTVSVNAAGGTSPYSYLWSNGDTTATGGNLNPGIYTVTVADAISCTATSVVAINSAPPPIISNISSTPTNFTSPNCNGGVTINPTGGTPPFSIVWSSGTTTNLCEGWYTATITDANGCLETDSVFVNFVTGIEELNAAGIFIYPNPVNDILTINSQNEIGEIKIYDVLGKLIHQELIKNNNAEINVKELEAGIYFIEIEGAVGKFVKGELR